MGFPSSISKSYQLASDFSKAQSFPSSPHNSSRNISWTPPPPMFSKLNSDAGFQQNGNTGLGMVIRDPTGVVVSSKVIKGLEHMEVELAEATAIQEGLDFTLSWNCRRLLVESDSLSVINKINNNSTSHILALLLKTSNSSALLLLQFPFFYSQANKLGCLPPS